MFATKPRISSGVCVVVLQLNIQPVQLVYGPIPVEVVSAIDHKVRSVCLCEGRASCINEKLVPDTTHGFDKNCHTPR